MKDVGLIMDYVRLVKDYVMNNPIEVLRWLFLLPIVFFVFIATGVASGLIIERADSDLFLWIGVPCAFTWVAASYVMAPKYKIIVSLVSWAAGAGFALLLVCATHHGHWSKDLMTTVLPYFATCASGLFAVLIAVRRESDREGGLDKASPWFHKRWRKFIIAWDLEGVWSN